MTVEPLLTLSVKSLIDQMGAVRVLMDQLNGWRAPSAEGIQVRFSTAEDEADLGKTLELVAAMERAMTGGRRP